MPLYAYKAASRNTTKVTTGTLSAPNAAEAANVLKKKNLDPITIHEMGERKKNTGRLPVVEKITFCRYMATTLNAGLSLSEGIVVLKQETKHPLMRQILDDMVYHMEQGQNLSMVFALYPQTFENFFVTLVSAGEVSGTLAESFRYLEVELRAEYALSQKIKSALMYPAIVVCAMIGIGSLMFFFVLPQIGKVFLNMTLPLPTFTKNMFTFSVKVAEYRLPLMISVVAAGIATAVFAAQPIGKKVLVHLISPIPVVNKLLRQVDIARFCRIFSTLLSSAVPITKALTIALNSLSLPESKRKAETIINEVNLGKPVASVFHQQKLFPALVTQMIAAGEKSGTMDQTLGDLAGFYESEVEESVKNATQLLEPALMLLVGIGVGAMILSIIAPLYSVIGSLQTGGQ